MAAKRKSRSTAKPTRKQSTAAEMSRKTVENEKSQREVFLPAPGAQFVPGKQRSAAAAETRRLPRPLTRPRLAALPFADTSGAPNTIAIAARRDRLVQMSRVKASNRSRSTGWSFLHHSCRSLPGVRRRGGTAVHDGSPC